MTFEERENIIKLMPVVTTIERPIQYESNVPRYYGTSESVTITVGKGEGDKVVATCDRVCWRAKDEKTRMRGITGSSVQLKIDGDTICTGVDIDGRQHAGLVLDFGKGRFPRCGMVEQTKQTIG